MSENPENYDLEPANDARPAPLPSTRGSKGEKIEPLPLEPDERPPSARSVKELDVCPNCGATMRGSNDLVCIRCGFDLKSNRPVDTQVSVIEVPGESDAAKWSAPLIRDGNGNFWLPVAIAAVSGLILLIGYALGLPALFPKIVASTPEGQAVYVPFLQRMEGLARTLLFIGMLTACSMGAMVFLAVLVGRKTADSFDQFKLGWMRMLAIVVTVQLATLLALNSPTWEWMLETLIQIGSFIGLTMALFRLQLRDAATLAGCTLIALVILWMLAYAVIWGMMPR